MSGSQGREQDRSTTPKGNRSGSMLVAGCDLGKASAKLVVAQMGSDGLLQTVSSEVVSHHADPLGVFQQWYRRVEAQRFEAVAVTGLYAREIVAPALTGLPVDACLAEALKLHDHWQGPINLISIGAQGYAVLVRNSAAEIEVLENEKCSSGTGETMVKIASRFGLSITEADELALRATESIPITARCSVFAKSEMTHFGNQGRSADQLFRGYFASVARYAAALLFRNRVAGPVLLVGGGSRLQSLVSALSELCGAEVIVPPDAQLWEAKGAASIAAGRVRAGRSVSLPDDPAELIVRQKRRFRTMAPAKQFASQVTRLSPSIDVGASAQPVVLGLDLGSTGSKAVVTAAASGEMLFDVYDRTRGNPVDGAKRLIEAVLGRGKPDVRAIGVTGSGREAVAAVLRATYPQHHDRIVVLNEIVAHATAAIRCDEKSGESLSVVEIGGQDAKFIQIAGGQIVASDMNKACSAGTGSFLEEQAHFYGVDDISEYGRLAEQAEGPPDLGQMCTVFVAETADQAVKEGMALPDIFAGFQFSVIHNYINRVMGQRTFGERIFFQGKPATSPSLAWTLAAVTKRKVIVPHNPGAMGAWGIGLCTIDELGAEQLRAAERFDVAELLAANVVDRGEIRCQDERCSTLCIIEKTAVAVGEQTKTVFSGGACPKFEEAQRTRPKLPRDAPSAFDQRRALLQPYLVQPYLVQPNLVQPNRAPGEGKRVVAVPLVAGIYHYLPWIVTLLRELGLGVLVPRSNSQSLARGEERCFAYDACAPAKVAHGIADVEADVLLLPKVLSIGDREGPGGRTCAVEQGLGEMIGRYLESRGSKVELLQPIVSLQAGLSSGWLMWQLTRFAEQLGVGRAAMLAAAVAAARAQRRYEADLAAIGEESLRYGKAHNLPTVVVCGALHMIHDKATNAQIPSLLRQNGVLALPMDCLVVPGEVPKLERVPWGDANRALRVGLAARQWGNIYPLMLSSFGCGPASFAEQFFTALMAGHPHTCLESDAHGGTAGYVTRIQAFLHAVGRHDGRPSAPEAGVLAACEVQPRRSILQERQSRMVALSVSERFGSVAAAFYRSLGFDAVAGPPTSHESFACGQQDCSGKECLVYQAIWGSFRQYIDASLDSKRTILLQLSDGGPCRNCVFAVKDQLNLERLGLGQQLGIRALKTEPEYRFDYLTRFWASVVSWDILFQLAAYYRPVERSVGAVDKTFHAMCDRLEEHVARPVRSGWRALIDTKRWYDRLLQLIEDAAKAFVDVSISRRADESDTTKRVLISGDVYLRLDAFANDRLIRRLNERGLHVLVEPLSVFGEYFTTEESVDVKGLHADVFEAHIYRLVLPPLRRRLYARARLHAPWIPEPEVPDMLERARQVMDRFPISEGPMVVGGVLHNWDQGNCDGVVVVAPWGCAPSLLAESVLRHEKQIPLLFLYSDGSPIDDRRIDAFTYRLGAHDG